MTMFTPLTDILACLFFSHLYGSGKLRSSEPEYDLLAQLIKPGDTVVDVGSNIGRWSLKCSNLVGPTGKVVAIEPNTRIQRIARFISLRYGVTNVCFIETCVSDTSGLVTFIEDWSAPKSAYFSTATRSKMLPQGQPTPSLAKQANPQLSYLRQKSKNLFSLRMQVSRKLSDYFCNYRHKDRFSEKLCVTLDQLAVKPSLIKIDVEGNEALVLKGGLSIFNSYKPIVVLEENGGDYEFMLNLGYITYKIEGSRNIVFCHGSDARCGVMMRALSRQRPLT